MTADLRSWAGLARSLVIYRARPWRIARLARFYRGIVAPGRSRLRHRRPRRQPHPRAPPRRRPRRRARAAARSSSPSSRRDLPARRHPPAASPPAARRAAPRLAVSRLHPTVSSLARGFAERMRAAPGFAGVRWDAEETVEVTTLDALIAAHGLPRFIKIDVEGFEAEVLAGLAQPGALGRLRVPRPRRRTPAAPASTRLAALGPYELQLRPRRRPALRPRRLARRRRHRPGAGASARATAARATSTPACAAMPEPRRALAGARPPSSLLHLLLCCQPDTPAPSPRRRSSASRSSFRSRSSSSSPSPAGRSAPR